MKIYKISEESKQVCKECHGNKFIYKKLQNRGTLNWVEHLLPCDTCNGKGYTTKEDHDSWMHSMMPTQCPHDKSQVKGVI